MGKTNKAVQNVLSPKAAPACEYVAIPDGSSSLAPVTRPGPSLESQGFLVFISFHVLIPDCFLKAPLIQFPEIREDIS